MTEHEFNKLSDLYDRSRFLIELAKMATLIAGTLMQSSLKYSRLDLEVARATVRKLMLELTAFLDGQTAHAFGSAPATEALDLPRQFPFADSISAEPDLAARPEEIIERERSAEPPPPADQQ